MWHGFGNYGLTNLLTGSLGGEKGEGEGEGGEGKEDMCRMRDGKKRENDRNGGR